MSKGAIKVTRDGGVTWEIIDTIKGEPGDGFTPKGTYSVGTTYSYLDFVYSSGSSYVYINQTPSAGKALNNGSYWQLLVGTGL